MSLCDCAEFPVFWSIDQIYRRSNCNRKIEINNSESDSLCADTTTKSVLYDFGPDFNDNIKYTKKCGL